MSRLWIKTSLMWKWWAYSSCMKSLAMEGNIMSLWVCRYVLKGRYGIVERRKKGDIKVYAIDLLPRLGEKEVSTARRITRTPPKPSKLLVWTDSRAWTTGFVHLTLKFFRIVVWIKFLQCLYKINVNLKVWKWKSGKPKSIT